MIAQQFDVLEDARRSQQRDFEAFEEKVWRRFDGLEGRV